MYSTEAYRGYRLVSDPEEGYVEIWSGPECVDIKSTHAKAQRQIDEWLDAR